MSYVYISDLSQSPAPAPSAPVAPTAATATALENQAKVLELTATAASAASPQAAQSLQAQAAAMRAQADRIRGELGGLSMGAKVGIGAAILAAVGGGYYMSQRPKTRANGRRR